MSSPAERPRRLRRSERLRAMVRETHVSPANLIYPLFVAPGRADADEEMKWDALEPGVSCEPKP